MPDQLKNVLSPTRMELTDRIRRLFWDRDLQAADIDAYPRWIVKRVLDYGDLPDIKAVLRYFVRERLFALLDGISFDSVRTARFWQQIMVSEGRSPCMKKPFRREAEQLWKN